jgi:uncharacterized membrane protein
LEAPLIRRIVRSGLKLLDEVARFTFARRQTSTDLASRGWGGLRKEAVMLDRPAHIQQHASRIELQAKLTHTMPPSNINEITTEERQALAAQNADGAKPE